jgi:hypothetical protein
VIDLRRDENDEVDDVVVENPRMFRMERMSDGRWWIRVYGSDGRDLVIDLRLNGQPHFEIE